MMLPGWHRERRGDELYIYYLGALIYKRWVSQGYGYVFDKHGSPFNCNR